MLIVTQPFVGHGYNMPTPGTLIDPPAPLAAHLVEIGVCAHYEAKVTPPPAEVKKKKPSRSSRPARVAKKKTSKKRTAKRKS